MMRSEARLFNMLGKPSNRPLSYISNLYFILSDAIINGIGKSISFFGLFILNL